MAEVLPMMLEVFLVVAARFLEGISFHQSFVVLISVVLKVSTHDVARLVSRAQISEYEM